MLSCFKILPVLLLLALLAACGGSGVNATTVSAVTRVPFTSEEVLNKTLYLVPTTGNQVIPSGPESDSLVGGVLYRGTKQIAGIQKEGDYWLVYDQNSQDPTISRLYLDPDKASSYLASKSIMGGSIQGTALQLADPAIVSTLAGTAGVIGSTNGIGTAARFYQPLGITTDGTNLYIADYYNHTIRMIDASKNVSTFAGVPGGAGSANGVRTAATFYFPSAVTTDGKNLYVTDSYNFTVRKISFGDNSTVTVAGLAGYSGAIDAVGDRARFNVLSGITTDGTNLYVTDSYNTIRKIVISSGAVSTLAGSAGLAGSADGTGTDARFDLPTGITTDGSFLYVTDYNNRIIRRISIATGKVETIVGNANADPPLPEVDISGSRGKEALFYQLHGMTSDGPNLYVTDAYPYKNTVYKIDKSSLVVTRLAGVGSREDHPGHTDSVDGPPTFYMPTGLTTDGTSLYVVDSQNHTIRNIK